MLILEGLVGLHRTIQLQLLSIIGRGVVLDDCNIEWFALEKNRDHCVIFEIAFQTLLLSMIATPFLLRNSCPQ